MTDDAIHDRRAANIRAMLATDFVARMRVRRAERERRSIASRAGYAARLHAQVERDPVMRGIRTA